MTLIAGHLLIVDDYPMNSLKISRAVRRLGHTCEIANDGAMALEMMRKRAYDLVLLDIVMPEMDGYEVLSVIGADKRLRNIPVIVISSEFEDMQSVVRCIKLGALDYLPKSFDLVLLEARVTSALHNKFARDQEREYLYHVEQLTRAAELLENKTFQAEMLDPVSEREDALGRLARVFQRMATEVYGREQRLLQELQQARLDVEEMQATREPSLNIYLPMDRRRAMIDGETLPETMTGAALFADISGFTALTLTLLQELGRRRGIEELPRHINRVCESLIAVVHEYSGSVIGFSGDAFTCWFDELTPTSAIVPAAQRAVACALKMQMAMTPYTNMQTITGTHFSLTLKVAIAEGTVKRLLVGDPRDHVIETMIGHVLYEMAAAEKLAQGGEIVVSDSIAKNPSYGLRLAESRHDAAYPYPFAVVTGMQADLEPSPWVLTDMDVLSDAQCRPWLQKALLNRFSKGNLQYLAELRLSTALFLRFGTIDYDGDPQSADKLDRFVRWVQQVAQEQHGIIIHLTVGDKGSYLFMLFGSPTSFGDDEARAIQAGLTLLAGRPPELDYISEVQIGISQGITRTGTYGSHERRTYTVYGDQVNLAARLMQAAQANQILCDMSVYRETQEAFEWESLPPINIKGKAGPVEIFSPLGVQETGEETIEISSALRTFLIQYDQLDANSQMVLKIASVLGKSFSLSALIAIFMPEQVEQVHEALARLQEHKFIVAASEEDDWFEFADVKIQQAVNRSMLFAQNRHLNRLVAEYWESVGPSGSAEYARLAQHWHQAGELNHCLDYLEQAGQQALIEGNHDLAERYLQHALALETGQSTLI